MSSLRNIFGKPTFVQGAGDIYPITLKHYDEFMDLAHIIMLKKSQFPFKESDLAPYIDNPSALTTLDYIALNAVFEQSDELLVGLKRIFELVTRDRVDFKLSDTFNQFSVAYFIGEANSNIIHSKNYEKVRKTILEQNLISEPKEYANPLVAEWAAKAAEAKAANSKINIDIESMISSLQIAMGQEAIFFENFTIYQLYSAFARLGKFKEFDTELHLIGHSDKIGQVHFAEVTELMSDPSKEAFVDSSAINNLSKQL
ncbi:hypothetical protein [Shouchella clausii]|uniref:hypothetical protein n=1 Tax=Shouchella clausii TaxID=79880 RepID=UPI001C729E40|nr:hypothetical protein [Shouchella clausii]MBX0320195.1 hypothetical protein [Shouchella clausii]